MKVLVLGGTRFVGRHIAAEALRRGHDLTLFNRGQTDPGAFPEAEHLAGDRREGDLAALEGRRFDALIDVSASFPEQVAGVAALGLAPHCTFVSTISVYRDPVAVGADEDAALTVSDEAYGGLKALAEAEVRASYPGAAFVVRSGLVAGPGDHTERFTYWPRRIARGGTVLAPRRDHPVQVVDARDLAAWVLDGTERRLDGTFNSTGEPATFAALLDACAAAAGTSPEIRWTDDAALLAAGLEPWSDLPLWLPEADAGFLSVSTARAAAAGFRRRPLAETVADTLAWDRGRPEGERRDALSPGREAEVLAATAPGPPAAP